MASAKNIESHVAGSSEATENRRASPRLPASAIPNLKSINLGTGPEVRLINISRGGALLEGDTRLQPSSSIRIRLVIDNKVLVLLGRVVRSIVSSMRGGRLRYESAITFKKDPLVEMLESEGQANPHPKEHGTREMTPREVGFAQPALLDSPPRGGASDGVIVTPLVKVLESESQAMPDLQEDGTEERAPQENGFAQQALLDSPAAGGASEVIVTPLVEVLESESQAMPDLQEDGTEERASNEAGSAEHAVLDSPAAADDPEVVIVTSSLSDSLTNLSEIFGVNHW